VSHRRRKIISSREVLGLDIIITTRPGIAEHYHVQQLFLPYNKYLNMTPQKRLTGLVCGEPPERKNYIQRGGTGQDIIITTLPGIADAEPYSAQQLCSFHTIRI
jgi:hypothetical protein